MPINSKQKGKRGELEFAAWIRDNFKIPAIRGVQYAGMPDSPDIVAVQGMHFEVKRVEAINVEKCMLQAIRDAGPNVPVLAHRRDRQEWLITIRASDWVRASKLIHKLGERLEDATSCPPQETSQG